MKNSKLTKILITVLSLALMIGAVIGFSASAEDESVAIVSQNVSYEGKTHLYYAVNYENVSNPEAISLVVTYADDNGEVKTVTVTESEPLTLKDSDGKDVICRAFRTPGVDAKNFTKVFTVKAITAAGTESAEKSYSVAEYCHQWLAYIATLETPTDKDLKIKSACESTLSYGTDIQALLDYYPEGNTEDYPENYVYVKGVDGVTVNGAKAACVIKGAEITLGYTGTETRIGWVVYNLEGTAITVSDDKFTANAYITAAPELDDATGSYYLSNAVGKRYDYDDGALLPQHQDGQAYSSMTNEDGAVKFTKTVDGSGTGTTFRWTPGCTATSSIYVFEADMKFSNITATTVGWIRIAACDNFMSFIVNQSGDNILIYMGTTTNGYTIKENEWHNIRIECDYANAKAVLCVDNVAVYTWNNTPLTSAPGSQYARFSMDSSAKVGDTYYFDNVFMGFTKELTTAE